MKRPFLATVAASGLVLVSCADTGCPPGTQLDTAARVCVREDAGRGDDLGLPDAAAVDAGPTDVGVDAGPCGMPCSGSTQCDALTGQCVECLSMAQCSAPTPVCSSAGACVECMYGVHCSGSTPMCSDGECVECTQNSDCPASDPVCQLSTHTCEPCTQRSDCDERTGTPACDVGSGACVLCDVPNESADCAGARCLGGVVCTACRPATAAEDCTSASASRCTAQGACAACEGPSDCAHIPGRNRCDSGLCVGCTVATEAQDCGPKSCNPATRTCTNTDRNTRLQCQRCVADSECAQAGGTFRCIPMNYMGADRGGYCMRAVDLDGGGCTRPYATPIAQASLSGAASATYCGIDQNATSCDAVRALLQSRLCPGGTAAECMAEGALCETVGVGNNQCTYPCTVPSECPAGGPSSTCTAGHCGS